MLNCKNIGISYINTEIHLLILLNIIFYKYLFKNNLQIKKYILDLRYV